jgi:predicted XRE-type DNA-binding protein
MQPFSTTEREEREEPILSDYNKPSRSAGKGQSDVKIRAKKGPRRAAGGAHIAESSGNVTCLWIWGLPTLSESCVRRSLLRKIYTILGASGMPRLEVAKILGVEQLQAAALMRNRAGSFSVQRLQEFLAVLRQHVRPMVRPARSA